MTRIIMPMATAVWLVDNSSLSFKQIADFCGFHEMEIQSIADGEFATNIMGKSPIELGLTTKESIIACEADPGSSIELLEPIITPQKTKKRYTPIAKRRDKPDAIAWILKNVPEVPDSEIVKLIGTTKNTIESIRNRTHANIAAIQPKDPVLLGLCRQVDLDAVIQKYEEKSK